MPEPDEITLEESTRVCIAARCRECGTVTHKCSIAAGVKVLQAIHLKGCSEPPGRLQLRLIVEDQVPELMKTDFGRTLLKTMGSWEVEQAVTALAGYLERKAQDD